VRQNVSVCADGLCTIWHVDSSTPPHSHGARTSMSAFNIISMHTSVHVTHGAWCCVTWCMVCATTCTTRRVRPHVFAPTCTSDTRPTDAAQVIMVAIQLLTKDSDSSSDGQSPFRSWAVWVSAGGLLLLAPLQLYLLNAMLASGSVTLSVPLYLSLMVLLVGVGGLAVLSYRQQLKILHQQQLEAQQQLHAGAVHSGVSKSSSGKSSSHRDERSEAVRDEVDPNLEAIVVDGAVYSGRAQGSHAAEPMGRGSTERATTTRFIRVDLVPERQPGTARATDVDDSARQTRFEADIVAPSAAAVSLATTAVAPEAAPEAAPAAPAAGAETESAGGHACSASAASVLAASDQGAQRGDAEDDDDPRLSL